MLEIVCASFSVGMCEFCGKVTELFTSVDGWKGKHPHNIIAGTPQDVYQICCLTNLKIVL